MVKQVISTSQVVQSFSFLFLLRGAQYRILNSNNNNNNDKQQSIYFNSADISERLPDSTNISQRRLEIRMFLYYKNKTRGDIFDEKGISERLR